MKKLYLILLLLVTSVLFAQQKKYTISGTLKDVNNGETLFGATVYIQNTTLGTTTNEYGFYSLTAPEGEYTLVISYIGYAAIEKEIRLNKNITFSTELREDGGCIG